MHTLAVSASDRNDPFMTEPGDGNGVSAREPNGGTPGKPLAPTATATGRRHSRWIWVSAVLAIAVVGLGIWALTLRSDRDDTQQELDTTKQELTSAEQQLDTTKQQQTAKQDDQQSSEGSRGKGAGLALGVTAKKLYDEFTKQLGATNEELEGTQQDLEDANKAAAKAEKDAAAAKQDAADAGDATDKAKAEAKQATAETQAAESKVKAAKGCAKAYIEAFGGLFEGGSVSGQAKTVRKDLEGVTAGCKDALKGT